MSDLYKVGERLSELAQTTDDIISIKSCIELINSREGVDLDSESLSSFLDTVSESDCRSLIYTMESADIIKGDNIDNKRLRAATGCGIALVEKGPTPENEVIVNVPEGEDEIVGKSLGSLVVRLMEIIGNADEEIVILNPFFTEEAFKNVVRPISGALEKGTSVTLITRYLTYGKNNNSRNFVREVLKESDSGASNLTLYEYLDSAGENDATIHAKMTLVDRKVAYLGTANLTHRGLRDNLEVGMLIRDETVNQLVSFFDDLLHSRYLHEVETDGDNFERLD